MPIAYNKIGVTIDLAALRHNWQLLSKRGKNSIAVVKSDAYGHGLVEVSRALAEEGAKTFAVGTVEEAVQLRESGVLDRNAHKIIALLGPIDNWEYAALAKHDILPFIGNMEQLERTAEATKNLDAPLAISLKFDTGMSRLGFALDGIEKLIARLRDMPFVKPVMASSHLATGDDPGAADFAKRQGEKFQAALAAFSKAGFQLEANLANSGAILGHPNLHHDSQRMGIALYGTNPFRGTPWEEKGSGLKQAMQASAPILEIRNLKAGQSVSYGRTFTAQGNMRIAIVGAGYADCYSRALSNCGGMCVGGIRVPIIGRVCMQMTAVDLTPLDETGTKQAQVGDRAWLLGGSGPGHVTADELANWWKTITYEVFCLLGLNKKQFTQ